MVTGRCWPPKKPLPLSLSLTDCRHPYRTLSSTIPPCPGGLSDKWFGSLLQVEKIREAFYNLLTLEPLDGLSPRRTVWWMT
jgi:hypothetical protein